MGMTLGKIKWWRWLAAIAVAAVVCALAWFFWSDVWQWSHDDKDSNAETLRNLALVAGAGLAALIGFPLALWRSFVAHAQAKTSERGLNNERYQKGADMLGSETLATRIGAVYALERLAQENPEEYHIQIVDLLCAFIRHPTKHDRPETGLAKDETEAGHDDAGSSEEADKKPCSPAVEVAAQILGRRSEAQINIERRSKEFRLDLRGVDLSGADLRDANLSGAELDGANFSGASLIKARFMGADLRSADFSGAYLIDANLSSAVAFNADLSRARLDSANLSDATLDFVDLSRARLDSADLSGAKLNRVKLRRAWVPGAKLNKVIGFMQEELDKARIWEGDEPPDRTDAVDLKTGKPLVWSGEVLPRDGEFH